MRDAKTSALSALDAIALDPPQAAPCDMIAAKAVLRAHPAMSAQSPYAARSRSAKPYRLNAPRRALKPASVTATAVERSTEKEIRNDHVGVAP
ncbi:MAG TPA: hypothetical protein VM070_00945, partial [Candidatus Saccharimonadales bacterium]|nr:hypothetical protein [Candidatus Saccharimonadales bacterium]